MSIIGGTVQQHRHPPESQAGEIAPKNEWQYLVDTAEDTACIYVACR